MVRRKIINTVIAFATAFSMFGMPATAMATDIADVKAQADSVRDELSAKQSELDSLDEQYSKAFAECQEAQAQLDAAEAELVGLQKELGEDYAYMYKRADLGTLLYLLVDSTNLNEFLENWNAIEKMSDQVGSKVDALNEKAAECKEIAEQKQAIEAELEQSQNEAQAVADDLQETLDGLDSEVASMAMSMLKSGDTETATEYLRGMTTGNAVVDRAFAEIGKPYVWGAVGPSSYDCSGLVSYCISGSHTRIGTTYTFMGWTQVSNPQPGDICTNSGHCGIYIGNGLYINAPYSGVNVRIDKVPSDMIYVRY